MRLVKIRTSPNFYVEWREAGQKKRVSTGTTDPAEAERFLAEFSLTYATEKPIAWPQIRDVLQVYYDEYASKKASRVQARIAKDRLSRFYGATTVGELGMAKQGLYVRMREDQGVSVETIRREQSVLSAALNWAHKWEKLPAQPPAVYMPPEGAPRERVLNRQEAARLLRQLRKNRRQRHLLLFTRLALYTGARSGAILGLTWDRVDFERGRINYIKPGRATTNKRAVIFPLTPDLTRMLEHAKKTARSDHVVEWGGEPVKRIIKAFRSQARAAGLKDVTPHTLRHTFGTWAAAGGANLHALGGAMGHSRTSTTDRYAKHQLEAMREVAEAARRRKRGKPGQAKAPSKPEPELSN